MHARFMNEFMVDEKYHNLMTKLLWVADASDDNMNYLDSNEIFVNL